MAVATLPVKSQTGFTQIKQMDVAANWQALLVSRSLHPYGLCMHLSTFFHVGLFENGRCLPLQPFYCGK